MRGCCFKTQFGSFKSGWIKAEDVFVAPTRKRWNGKNENFVVLDEGETFSTTFSRRAEQRLETVPPCFRKLEKNWTRQGREWLVVNIWQLANSFHQNLATGNCPWLGEAGHSNKYNVRTQNGQSVFLAFLPVSLQVFCLIVRKNLITQNTDYFAVCTCEARRARLRLLRYAKPILRKNRLFCTLRRFFLIINPPVWVTN